MPRTSPFEYTIVPPVVVDGPPIESFTPFAPPSVVEKKCESVNASPAVVTSFRITKLCCALAHGPRPAPSTADALLPAPELPPIPSRYTGVSDCGHVYGGMLKLPFTSVVVEDRTVAVDPYPVVPTA